mmetsp:Transcript_17234/g.42000  ORF Transcript_17234/g.42000 Transcript_17234/m.42000 type:complete len:104 (+) Transcript_17234:554-865(+)|eukprot:CAMPEP_0113638594 /NCGR_PEP_ID=MMETSP0017_2-20120614/20224_1 /TAXON_ID=2856 /ORGANISM="Cylindrotheca closterium" /LENGTH=103 /DNA_ID=CAMNT_0000549721 /DNA_START=1747 /DNA_END=2058 /DNA_ORIENTATION=- /assembly_acc=CAM_ASM_000147
MQRKMNTPAYLPTSASGMDSLSVSARTECSTMTTNTTITVEESLPPSATSPSLVRRNSALDTFMQDLLAGRETELIIDSARSSPTKSWESSDDSSPHRVIKRR